MWLLCVLGYPSGLVLAVFGTHWSLLAAMLGYSIVFVTVFLYIMEHVCTVCFGTWPVLCTVIDLGHGQSWALSVLMCLSSHKHCLYSWTWPVLCTLCVHVPTHSCALVCLGTCPAMCTLCVLVLALSCAMVCSCTLPVLCTVCLLVPGQSCAQSI